MCSLYPIITLIISIIAAFSAKDCKRELQWSTIPSNLLRLMMDTALVQPRWRLSSQFTRTSGVQISFPFMIMCSLDAGVTELINMRSTERSLGVCLFLLTNEKSVLTVHGFFFLRSIYHHGGCIGFDHFRGRNLGQQ